MKNKMKRITAFFLAIFISIGLLPALEVRAETNAFGILQYTQATESYEINISFQAPDFSLLLPAGSTFLNYHLQYRNRTKNEAYNNTQIIRLANTATTGTVTENFNVVLEPASIYEFRLIPNYRDTVTLENHSGSPIDYYLVQTNFDVEAVGEGNTMEVKWKVPTIDGGQHFYPQYNIYYATIKPLNDTTTWNDGETDLPEVVLAKDIVYDEDGFAVHSFTNTNFKVGEFYTIRIEPILPNGGKSRDMHMVSMDIIGNKGYYVRDLTNHYKSLYSYIRPNVTVTRRDLNSVTITWDSLDATNVSQFVDTITVKTWKTNPDGTVQEDSPYMLTRPDVSGKTTATIQLPDEEPRTFFIEVTYLSFTYKIADLNKDYHIPRAIVISVKKTLDPAAKEFDPYRPDIYEITDNRQKPFQLDIAWKAFLRNSYSESEEVDPFYGKYIDKDVTYEVRITDDPTHFNQIPASMIYTFDGNDLEIENIAGAPHYRSIFNQYARRTTDNIFEQVPLEQNKIYYVSITAVRNATDQRSEPAYGTHYIIPIDKLPIEPNIIAKPPLRIKTVDGLEEVTETTITIEWDEQWVELFNPEDEKWYSKAAIVGNSIVYGDDVKDSDNFLVTNRVIDEDRKLNQTATKNRIKDLLTNYYPLTAPAVLRVIDVSGADYKVHTVEYDVMAAAEYDLYFQDITNPNTQQVWASITPTGRGTLEAVINSSQNPVYTPLKPGTPYAIFLWPYVTDNNEDKLAYYPSYIAGTTLKDRGELDIKPVIPILEAVSVTDFSVTVRWEYIQELEYELKFSNNINSYPAAGITISNEKIVEDGKLETIDGKLYMVLTIHNLFPKTMYYLWIRSSYPVTGEVSDWSNPIEMTTTDIQAPPPPQGLGYASEQNVYYYNRDNGTNYKPYDEKYMLIEFLRIAADMKNDTEGQKGGGAGATNGTATFLPNEAVPETYMTMFEELIANRTYFVRAKTRLHVTQTGDGIAQRHYSYILQVSLDPDFLDPIEIEVPTSADINTGIYKDSEWVSVHLITGPTTDEYDGDKDNTTYPLPDRDYEIWYDSATKTLYYRFRSNQTDKDGKKDNLVDERFITRLINSGTYTHEIDVTKYGNRVPSTRVIEIPITIFTAFNERKIDFKVKADNFTIVFPHGSLLTTEILNLAGLDRFATVKITLSQNPSGILDAAGYLSAPHKVAATVSGSGGTVNITNFAKPLQMNMVVSGTYNENTTNIGAYVQDANTGGWQVTPSTFDTITQSVNFASVKAASYCSLGLLTPAAYEGSTLTQMYRANSKLTILDLQVYDENAFVHANQFNQIAAAALRGQNTVNMNQQMSNDDFLNLGKAGILVSGNNVSREAGISALVKLYEVKTKYPVTGQPSLLQTSYRDILNADEKYRPALLKAAELGFYREAVANPKGNMTMGDLMHIIDIILAY